MIKAVVILCVCIGAQLFSRGNQRLGRVIHIATVEAMGQSDDDEASGPPGGHAARRLQDFLRGRLPPGVSPEKLNPELLEETKDKDAVKGEKRSTPKNDIDQDQK